MIPGDSCQRAVVMLLCCCFHFPHWFRNKPDALFSVAQFYHFAFMIVSLALLDREPVEPSCPFFPGWAALIHKPVLAGWLCFPV